MKHALAALLALLAAPVLAGEVEIVAAAAERAGAGWRFDVTLRHGDEGWDHYADAWRVTGPGGEVHGERTLLHPHVDEQPFTRSLSGVQIPADVSEVVIEAHDSVHGWAPEGFALSLPE